MASINIICPHCGANITCDDSLSTYKCQYCHQITSLSSYKNNVSHSKYREELEEVIKLRNNCDFDEALEKLESLISLDSNNPELYYQYLLCNYCIGFVLEDSTKSEKPILNRISENSLFNEPYYKKLEQLLATKPEELKVYEKQLKYIDELREKAIERVQNEKPYDIFICYKRMADSNSLTRDSETARKLYDKFTSWGYRTFFAQKTLHEEHIGEAFEPYIYSALMSAKIFVLVCASPDHPEYLISPWVKSEWIRFKKRIENEDSQKLLLLPVFDHDFKPSQLPKTLSSKKLGNFQGIDLNDEFDRIVSKRFYDVLVSSNRKQFKKIEAVNGEQVVLGELTNITLKTFKKYDDVKLSALDEVDYDLAIADMATNTEAGFNIARDKLKELSKNNKFNFRANLAILKCDLKVPMDKELSFGVLDSKNLELIAEDYVNVFTLAPDNDKTNILDQMEKVMLNAFRNNLEIFSRAIRNLIDTHISMLEKPDLILSFLNKLEGLYLHLSKNLRCYNNSILLYDLFAKYYPYCGKAGMIKLARLYALENNYAEAYKIMPHYPGYIWENFIQANKIKSLVEYVNEETFVPFDPSNENKKDNSNLYYILLLLLKCGYTPSFTEKTNYFANVFEVAKILTNKKETIGLAKKIFKSLFELSGGSGASDSTIIYLLIQTGNRLLIEEEYKEASEYYLQALSIDDNNLDARWGLTKIELGVPTNYGVVCSDKNLSQSPEFKNLLARVKTDDNNQNIYLNLYKNIQKLKADSTQYDGCKDVYLDNEKFLLDMDNPTDISLNSLISQISSNKFVLLKDNFSYSGQEYSRKLISDKMKENFAKQQEIEHQIMGIYRNWKVGETPFILRWATYAGLWFLCLAIDWVFLIFCYFTIRGDVNIYSNAYSYPYTSWNPNPSLITYFVVCGAAAFFCIVPPIVDYIWYKIKYAKFKKQALTTYTESQINLANLGKSFRNPFRKGSTYKRLALTLAALPGFVITAAFLGIFFGKWFLHILFVLGGIVAIFDGFLVYRIIED